MQWRRLLNAALALILLALGQSPAQAQTGAGAICVATFADLNGNGARDPGEGPLAGVHVTLATGGVIIATHLTTEGEDSYCFENLLRGSYTISFTDAPIYRTTTPREGTFALDAGQRLLLDPFGAVPIPPEALRAEALARWQAAQPADTPLPSSTRLFLATAGALLVMMLMIGIGAVILGLLSFRRSPLEPPEIAPPPR